MIPDYPVELTVELPKQRDNRLVFIPTESCWLSVLSEELTQHFQKLTEEKLWPLEKSSIYLHFETFARETALAPRSRLLDDAACRALRSPSLRPEQAEQLFEDMAPDQLGHALTLLHEPGSPWPLLLLEAPRLTNLVTNAQSRQRHHEKIQFESFQQAERRRERE